MTYNPDYPENTPPPDTGINNVRTNFSTYATIFSNNHVALNANNQGKHSNVILQQVSDPSVEGGFDALYSNVASTNLGATLEIFAKIPQFLSLDKPNNPEQLTFHTVNTAGPVYQSFLPGGYLLFFGQVTQIAQVNPPVIPIVVTLSPVPTEILCVIANSTNVIGTSTTWGQPMSVNVINNSQFQINPTGIVLVNHIIPWIAIAKQ